MTVHDACHRRKQNPEGIFSYKIQKNKDHDMNDRVRQLKIDFCEKFSSEEFKDTFFDEADFDSFSSKQAKCL